MTCIERAKRRVAAILFALVGLGALVPAAQAATVNGITVDVNLPNAQRGALYQHQIVPTGGGGAPYTFQVIGGAFPAGISVNASGFVYGVSCASNGSYSIGIRITSSTGVVADFVSNPNLFTLGLNAGPAGCDLTVTLGALPTTGYVGSPYSGTATATGGTTPYTFSIASGALPPGVTLDPVTGVVSGTPTTEGVYNFQLRVTDANGLTGSTVYTITVLPGITVLPVSIPGGTFNVAYATQVFSATGGNGGPYTFALTGTLPTGMSWNAASATLSGTPLVTGTFPITVTATDSLSIQGSRSYDLIIAPVVLTVAPASLPNGTYGTAYNQTVTASGGNGSYTYSVSPGSLPNGLSLNPATGAITGTPALVGSFTFTVSVTDTAGNSGSQAYTVAIAGVTLTIAPATLNPTTVNLPYSQALTVTGGSGTGYTCAVTAGSLPAGITLNTATCTLSGTPTVAGSYSFTITATDDAGNTGSQAYTLAVNQPVTVSPATLPDGTFGVAYSQTVAGAGGDGGPYTLALTGGALPNGLSFNAATGVISGTPTLVGSYSFTVSATDGLGETGSRTYEVDIGSVALTLAPASLPNGTFGSAYSQTVTASGGNGSYTYSVSAGALPGGLALNPATGVISGSPTALGTFNFTLGVVDGAGNSGSRAYSITVLGVTLAIAPASLPAASLNGPYSQALTVTGGSGTGYTCAVTSGTLPPGITLNTATCTLSGQATAIGSYSFTITATDSAGNTGSRSYSLSVLDALVLTPATLPGGTWGVAYSQTVSGAGGNGSYTYAVSAGSLPNGLSLNTATGAITGTPSQVGSFSFTITVTDGLGETASQAYTVAIAGVTLAIAPASLPNGEALLPYSQALTVTGGSGSGYTCAVTAGALPAGITLNAATCTLSGTPTTAGSYSFTITATDSGGNTGSRAYSLQIGAALVITITPATLPDGEAGESYSEQLSASGGVGPYTFAVTAGTLPAGLVLNPTTGLLSGTPTQFGDFTFTVRATDADGRVGSQAYTLTLEGRPDPVRDPEVGALIDGQFGLARRFGEGQIMNVMRHLEGNRSAFRCGLKADLGLSGDNDSRGRNALDPEDNQARSGVTLGTSGKECDETLPRLGYWVSGSLSDDDYRGQDFTSDALSAGLDVKFSDKLMAGAAVGFGWGDAGHSSAGTQSDADATTFMAYLSYNPMGRLYVEAMVGGGDLSIDSERFVTYDGSMVSGKRNGSLTLGSIGLAGDMIDSEKVLLTGYLRYDMVKIDLERYEEQGATQLALGFGAADQSVNSLVVGGRAAYSWSRSWGLLTPMMRAEYRMRAAGHYRQDMAYLDLPGIEYSLRQASDKEGSLSLSLGFEALIQGWTLGMEYGTNPLSSSGMSGDMVRATVRYGF